MHVRRWIVCLTALFGLTFGVDSSAAPFSFVPQELRPALNLPGTDEPASTFSVINVLDYVRQNITQDTIADLDTANPGYNRRQQFGGWVSGEGCLDTRGEILVRSNDSAAPLKYKDARQCAVVKGLWHDPYAGNDYKLAKAVQIDHVVPLKHVYLTGGKKWAPAKRCYYANFTHNDFHLLAVSGHENMSKSDKSPAYYMPPNDSFQCQYVAHWMKIKTIWQLISTEEEVDAIEDVIRTHHCSVSKMQMSSDDLAEERAAIKSSVPSGCQEFGNAILARSAQLELPFGH